MRQLGDGARRAAFGRPALLPSHVEDALALRAVEADAAADTPPGAYPQPGFAAGAAEGQLLEAFIAQRTSASVPSELIVSHPVAQALIAALTEQSGVKIHLTLHPREQRRAWLEMAQHNADLQLARLLAEEGFAASAHPCAGRGAGLGSKISLTSFASSALTFRTPLAEARKASCIVVFQQHEMQPRLPPLQHRRHHARRRLRRHAPSALPSQYRRSHSAEY